MMLRLENRMKKAILLVAFGSGSPEGESMLRGVDLRVRERFPGIAVRWAFTSGLMRQQLAKVRKKSDSVGKALRRMTFEGITRIAIQPLHVVPGMEYAAIIAEVETFVREAGSHVSDLRVGVGEPLLDNRSNYCERACRALLASLPPERHTDEAVLWMGHGSQTSSELYNRLGELVQTADPLVFVGTINGSARLEDLLPYLNNVRRVWLLPLLTVVGRHALEDMAGASPHSWLSRLKTAGIQGIPVLRGMVESPAFMHIWLDHLNTALRGIEEERFL